MKIGEEIAIADLSSPKLAKAWQGFHEAQAEVRGWMTRSDRFRDLPRHWVKSAALHRTVPWQFFDLKKGLPADTARVSLEECMTTLEARCLAYITLHGE